MRTHHLIQIVSRLSRSLRETLNGEPRSARSVPARYLLPLAASPQETSHFELCNAYPLVPTVSRLSGLCLAFLLLAAGASSAQNPPVGYPGMAPGDLVRVVLKDGMSIDGRLMRMTDSTLVLSAAKAPIAVLQQRSLPLEVSQTSVTLLLSNGSRMTGQVVGLTEHRLVFRKEGTTGNVFVDRSEVVAVSNRGRKTGASAVALRKEEITLITKLTSYVNGVGALSVLLKPGARVRVKAFSLGESPVIGTLVSLNPEGIVTFKPDGKNSIESERQPASFSMASIKQFEISKGTGMNRGLTVLKGLGIGAGLGTVGGIILYAMASDDFLAVLFVPAGLIIGTPIGLLCGMVAAAVEQPTERWQTVPVSRIWLSLGMPRRDRFASKPEGMALNVSFKF